MWIWFLSSSCSPYLYNCYGRSNLLHLKYVYFFYNFNYCLTHKDVHTKFVCRKFSLLSPELLFCWGFVSSTNAPLNLHHCSKFYLSFLGGLVEKCSNGSTQLDQNNHFGLIWFGYQMKLFVFCEDKKCFILASY